MLCSSGPVSVSHMHLQRNCRWVLGTFSISLTTSLLSPVRPALISLHSTLSFSIVSTRLFSFTSASSALRTRPRKRLPHARGADETPCNELTLLQTTASLFLLRRGFLAELALWLSRPWTCSTTHRRMPGLRRCHHYRVSRGLQK